MQATLDAFSLKVFTKALTCLSKYGDELSIYATPEFLSLSATNSSKSAYCRFKYDRHFFSKYRLGAPKDGWDDEIQEIENVTGQLMTKSFLSILKHRTVEKSVERCELSIVEGKQTADSEQEDEDEDSLESKLIVRMHCKHGVIKTHRLLLLTQVSLMAPGVPDATNESRLTIGPKALKDLLDHFPVAKGARSDPQLVWTFEDGEVGLKSMESSIDSRGRGQLSTEISISAEEFDVYDVYETPTTIAFHLREFNATIAFADSMSLPLDLRFTDPAAPLFIDIDGDAVEILFVISTSQVQGAPSSTQRNSQAVNTRKRDREQSTHETPRMKKPMKVVQPVAPERETPNGRSTSNSRAGSHIPGSMPPPSVIPNRAFSQTVQPQDIHRNSSSSYRPNPRASPAGPKQSEPLFLPSSQMSVADEQALRAIGLEAEDMDVDQLAELLEGEGEEVDFSYHAKCPNINSENDVEIDGPDSFELVDDGGLSATQSSDNANKVCFFTLPAYLQPLIITLYLRCSNLSSKINGCGRLSANLCGFIDQLMHI
ncbi:Rad9-domain-containing protein [Flammula alnicola]|nr:Rad9-domain-containing protein [Flammula alnicola]